MSKIVPIPARVLVRIFEKAGFKVLPRKGTDHIRMRKEGCDRPLIIPDYQAVPVFIIKNNMRTAQMSNERFFQLRSEV